MDFPLNEETVGFSLLHVRVSHSTIEPVLESLVATTAEPMCHNYRSPHTLEPVLHNKRWHSNEKPSHHKGD